MARGLGTRMRAPAAGADLTAEQDVVASAGLKAMIPLAGGRPMLDFILASLADAGVTDAGIVVAPGHQAIRDRYSGPTRPRRIAVDFIIQSDPSGTADAVLAAADFVQGEEFLVVNGDNLYPAAALRALVSDSGGGLIGYHPESLIARSNIAADRIATFALAWATEGWLSAIVEKPAASEVKPGALVSMNSWRFTPRIFDSCRAIEPSPRGELELRDAVVDAMARGERFRVIESHDGVLDLSSRTDIGAVTERLRAFRVVL